jgi:hypothetical protein
VKLKIYSHKSFLPPDERHVVLLFPFWGLIPEPKGDKDTGRFDEYAKRGVDFFELVPTLDAADAALLPFEWRSRSQWGHVYADRVRFANRLADEAHKFHKRVIIFFNNDSDEPIPVDHVIIFRTSFYRSRRGSNEFAFPGWSIDFLGRYLEGRPRPRKKGLSPVVGYCGYVDYDLRNLKSLVLHVIRKLLGKQINSAASLRGRAVRALRSDRRLNFNFICRTGFAGTAGESARLEYVRNIVESDYALVTRGAGNFSYRLYEVLSCGRIPVFIDTDCVLPFDHVIDWKKYCVWTDASELDSLADKICEFHDTISETEFEELQRSIRNLYENWISPVGFYRNLWRCIMPDARAD